MLFRGPGALSEMYFHIDSRANPGVFSSYDAVGLQRGCQGDEEEDRTGGIDHLARGGCVVAECLKCDRVWSLTGLPTLEHGPLPADVCNPQGRNRKWKVAERARD